MLFFLCRAILGEVKLLDFNTVSRLETMNIYASAIAPAVAEIAEVMAAAVGQAAQAMSAEARRSADHNADRASSLEAFLVSVRMRLTSAESGAGLRETASRIAQEIDEIISGSAARFDSARENDGVFVCSGCETGGRDRVRYLIPAASLSNTSIARSVEG